MRPTSILLVVCTILARLRAAPAVGNAIYFQLNAHYERQFIFPVDKMCQITIGYTGENPIFKYMIGAWTIDDYDKCEDVDLGRVSYFAGGGYTLTVFWPEKEKDEGGKIKVALEKDKEAVTCEISPGVPQCATNEKLKGIFGTTEHNGTECDVWIRQYQKKDWSKPKDNQDAQYAYKLTYDDGDDVWSGLEKTYVKDGESHTFFSPNAFYSPPGEFIITSQSLDKDAFNMQYKNPLLDDRGKHPGEQKWDAYSDAYDCSLKKFASGDHTEWGYSDGYRGVHCKFTC